MRFHFFASTMGLPWSNAWRKMYRESRGISTKDPLIQNIFRVLAVLTFIIFLATGKALLQDMKRQGGSIHLPMSLGEEVILASFFVSLVLFLFSQGYSRDEEELAEVTRKLAEVFGVGQGAIKDASESQLVAHATLVLNQLGEELRRAELASGNPLDAKRVAAKKAFEDVYRPLVRYGLIDDVGYGRFIQLQQAEIRDTNEIGVRITD